METRQPASQAGSSHKTDIAVLALPRISNFDDFDPLKAEPGVSVRYVRSARELGSPDAIIIPGTKSTIADMGWLDETGLAEVVVRFARSGGAVAGICGGYQMFGERIDDPKHVESPLDSLAGLNLLPAATHFLQEKATFQAQARIRCQHGWLAKLNETTVSGYEIHMGGTPSQAPWLEIALRNDEQVQVPDGCVSPDGKVWGCYLHGIFANDAFRHAWLESLGWQKEEHMSQAESFERSLDALADAVEGALNMELLDKIVFGEGQRI